MKLASKCLSVILLSHIPFSFQLRCYSCMSKRTINLVQDKEILPNQCPREMEEWPRKICKAKEVCYSVEYTIKEVRYIVRGCNSSRICGFHCKDNNATLQKLNNFSHLYCFVCDDDLCNSGKRIIQSLLAVVYLIAVQIFL